MGTARAVVVGSTSCPACSARVSNPYSCIFWSAMSVIRFSLPKLSLTFEERRNGRPQLVPVFQERVVPAQRVYLHVARVSPGLSHPPGRSPHLVRREEPVARDPDEKYFRLDPGVCLFLGLVAQRD